MDASRLTGHEPDPQLGSAAELLACIARAHERTRQVVVLIPSEEYDWAPRHGWYTLGDLVRHLAGTERWTYAESVQGRANRYPGHGRELADSRDATLAYYDRLHAESMAIFATLNDAALLRPVATAAGKTLPLRSWLRAMIEHEAHHRGQIYLLLAMRGVATPAFTVGGDDARGLSIVR